MTWGYAARSMGLPGFTVRVDVTWASQATHNASPQLRHEAGAVPPVFHCEPADFIQGKA